MHRPIPLRRRAGLAAVGVGLSGLGLSGLGLSGLGLSGIGFLGAARAQPADLENTLFLDLKQGRVEIRLLPEVAPKHVARIKALARQGFYDGTPFHRVIEGFMAQGGDPTGTGTGGSSLPNLPPEFSERHFYRGVCGMARSSDPASGNSQFFIMFAPAPSLDGKYTVWGMVTRGMEYVDQIKRGTGPNGQVVGEPDRIIHLRVAADVK